MSTFYFSILDCLVECSTCSDLEVALGAVQCADALLGSLNIICDGDSDQILSKELVDKINESIKSFTTADVARKLHEKYK